MRPKYSQSDIDEICTPFFDEIRSNHFQIKFTVSGSLCIIISRRAGGDKPIMGVYWTGDEWIPAKWNNTGHYQDSKTKKGLDLDLVLDNKDAA